MYLPPAWRVKWGKHKTYSQAKRAFKFTGNSCLKSNRPGCHFAHVLFKKSVQHILNGDFKKYLNNLLLYLICLCKKNQLWRICCNFYFLHFISIKTDVFTAKINYTVFLSVDSLLAAAFFRVCHSVNSYKGIDNYFKPNTLADATRTQTTVSGWIFVYWLNTPFIA